MKLSSFMAVPLQGIKINETPRMGNVKFLDGVLTIDVSYKRYSGDIFYHHCN